MKRALLLLLLLSLGFAAGMVVTARSGAPAAPALAPAPAAPPAEGVTAAGQGAGRLTVGAAPDFTRIAAKAVRSVVNISSTQIVSRPASPFSSDPFFRYFFGDPDDIFGGIDRQSSLGSGVIVSPDGYVLTNNHVIGERAEEVSVVLADKRELPARIVGVDPWTDLALLDVEAADLPTVPWGDSSHLRIAEWVLAIGNPFQLNQTVTLGIISAVGRANVGIATYEDFIQTDAAINPGNSGGALVDARGELIGINTAIYSQSGGYQGIGFAIPSNLAQRVMTDLIEYGQVRRGSIGYVEIAPITTQLARHLGLRGTAGALIARMSRSSAAYAAGLRPGDAIVSFNGQEVADAPHLLRLLSDAPIGSTASLGVVRGGDALTIDVEIQSGERRRGRMR